MPPLNLENRLQLTFNGPRAWLGWTALGTGYLLLFLLLFQVIDRAAIIANLLPIVVCIHVHGRGVGLAVALVLIPANLLCFYLIGGLDELAAVSRKFWVAQVGMMLIFYLLGRTLELRRQFERELIRTRELQQQLLDQRNQAVAASQAKDELLATISHDLRTPISGIIQSARLLEQHICGETRRQLVDNIQTSSRQLLQVVNDLLDGYRQEVREAVEVAETFRPREQIAHIASLMKPLFQEKGLSLDYQIAPQTPDFLTGYPKLLRQTCFNLLGNSLKFTTRGGTRIRVSSDPAAGLLRVHITDTGQGIAPEHIPAILDRSYRYSHALPEGNGSSHALGLHNCLRMTDTMKGELSIHSSPGEGTTVTLSLPLIVPPRPAWIDRPRQADPLAQDRPPPGRRVLLIEDDETNIISLTASLELLHCRVTVARDAGEAAGQIGRPFDLILVDRQLPDGPSDGFISGFRQISLPDDRRPPVVLLTANVLIMASRDWQSPEVDLVLTKPVGLEELQRLLEHPVTDPEPAAGTDEPLLDLAFMEQERQLLGEEVMDRIRQGFLIETPAYLRQCLLEYGKQNYPRCADQAHKLGGAARSTGLPRLARLTRQVEEDCRSQDRIRLYASLTRLQDCFQGSCRALQKPGQDSSCRTSPSKT